MKIKLKNEFLKTDIIKSTNEELQIKLKNAEDVLQK